MLTVLQLRTAAQRSGVRDIANIEFDVLLTFLLQLFHEKGLSEHIAFKGGTMLRKMVFGPRGRLSTDLDFTCRTDISKDDLQVMLLDALNAPYHDITFKIQDNNWYLADDAIGVNPTCYHEGNEAGVKIKIQISFREKPILKVEPMAQIDQEYFSNLPFKPIEIPCLAFEEVIAEKIRAASQRSKIRDLHDLSELAKLELNREKVRPLSVVKLWESGGPGLSHKELSARIIGTEDYDIADLTNLLRKDERPDLNALQKRVIDGFRFLSDLTELEKKLSLDAKKALRKEAEELKEIILKL